MSTLTAENIIDVVDVLIGPVEPYGSSEADAIRLENIDKLISLTSVCLDNIIEASRYWDSPAASMAKIGERAYKAIDEYEQWIKDERNK